jgi:hypothetical protein
MKPKRAVKLFLAVILTMIMALTANLAWANGVTVLPGTLDPSHTYGMTYGDWGAAWWQWVTLGTTDHHVLRDTTGKEAYLNQPLSNPVFFLGGSWVGPVTRNVTISSSKALFFPIFNWVLSYPEDVPAGTSDALGFIQNKLNSAFSIPGDYLTKPEDLAVLEHGQNLITPTDYIPDNFQKNYRGTSEPFGMYFPSNCFEVTTDSTTLYNPPNGDTRYPHYLEGIHIPTVSDGYWMMIAPLDPGKYDIHILGGGQDVTYNLTVTPLPSTLLFFGSGFLGLLGFRASRRP